MPTATATIERCSAVPLDERFVYQASRFTLDAPVSLTSHDRAAVVEAYARVTTALFPVRPHRPVMLPLQIPGGVELFIIFLIIALPLAFMVALGAGVYLLKRGTGDDVASRLAAIETRLDEIESRLTETDE